jgi:hypothetical protein
VRTRQSYCCYMLQSHTPCKSAACSPSPQLGNSKMHAMRHLSRLWIPSSHRMPHTTNIPRLAGSGGQSSDAPANGGLPQAQQPQHSLCPATATATSVAAPLDVQPAAENFESRGAAGGQEQLQRHQVHTRVRPAHKEGGGTPLHTPQKGEASGVRKTCT